MNHQHAPTPGNPVPMEITWNRHPKWEQQLPSKLVISLVEDDGSTSLKLKVELEMTAEPPESSSTVTMPRATGSIPRSSPNPFQFTMLVEL